MKCQIENCKRNTNYNYGWKRKNKKLELWICTSCNDVLLRKLLKQKYFEESITKW